MSDALLRGRRCYERHEWDDAYRALLVADQEQPLGAEDLHRLAWSAGLTGRDEDMLATQERAYQPRLDDGEEVAAGRAAFWLGFRLLARGEPARASGWLSRAQRLVENHAQDCVEQGYLLLPASQRHLGAGEFVEAHDCAARAVQIGERFTEPDLIAFGRNLQGRTLLAAGEVRRGLELLDEAMVAVTRGELSPVVTGIVYCSAIASCHRVFALERVREWTAALSSWCEANPQLGMFTGHCLVHRAEILEMSGSWPEAVHEARRAVQRCVRSVERDAAGRAHYQQAEIHRLRGEFELADAAYREASRSGFEPQPGLALLRLAEGDKSAAANASRRMMGATRDLLARTRFLPAHVDIMLAIGDLDAARVACKELQETAATLDTEVLAAIAARASGSIHLAEGNAHAVLDPVRRAFGIWQRLGAPYLAARLRVLLARACIAAGDPEGAQLELEAAQEVFEQLGAKPDLALADAIRSRVEAHQRKPPAGLTERELQVLRLVATGKTNKAIAREPVVERENDRSPPQQHLRQGGRCNAGRGYGIRVRAPADVATAWTLGPNHPWRVLQPWGIHPKSASDTFHRLLSHLNLSAGEVMTFNESANLIEEGAASIELAARPIRPAGHTAERFDVIVIGAGQAGLSVGYHLARAGARFVVLDENARVGDSWRKRWDSLRLFTPAKFNGLDGMPFPARGNYFPTKDEMASYLETYARRFQLPVRSHSRVERLFRRGSRFVARAGTCEYEADHVVVAMAKYQKPKVPPLAVALSPEITQLHSHAYRNTSQLQPGGVVLVGGGNSGADIAMEVARAGHKTWMAGRDNGQVPFRPETFWGRNLIAPFVIGFVFHHVLTVKTPMGRRLRPAVLSKGAPLIRVKRSDLKAAGVERVPRVVGVREGKPALEDGRTLRVANVIWCTGFETGFEWIDLPILGDEGEVGHCSGIVESQPGLYFVGLPFLHAMSSSMIHGVGRDAARIVEAIEQRLGGSRTLTRNAAI